MARQRFNNINNAKDLGTLGRRKNAKGTITRADKNDFYKFDLSGSSSLSVRPQQVQSNLLFRLFDGDRTRIGQTRFGAKGNKRRQTFERDLEAGTFFIQVRGNTREGRDRYRLRLGATALNTPLPGDPGNPSVPPVDPDGTRSAGVVSGNYTNTDSVGVDDPLDLYNFSLTEASTLNAQLSGLSQTVGLELFNDANADGAAEDTEAIAFTPGTPIELAAGSYIIRVNGNAIPSNTDYTLTLDQAAIPTDDGNGTLATASDLGVVTTTTTRNSTIGGEDDVDFYKFTLNDIANLDVRTEGDAAGRFQLIRDDNGNSLVDDGEVFAPRSFSSFSPLDMPPGDYYIRVESFRDESGDYTLTVVPTLFGGNVSPEPGNTLNLASNELGVFSGTRTFKEYVGTLDEIDLYRFTLNDLSNLQITFSGSSNEIRTQLIRDDNNNGLIDSEEIFASRDQVGDSGTLSQDLPVGNYFILVQPEINSSFSTSYEMTVVGTPYGGDGSPDPGNTLSEARNLGALTGTTSLKEHVGFLDLDDFYRFTLSTTANLQARITLSDDSNSDLNTTVIRDANNNGQVDNDEVVDFGINGLTDDLEAGTYFFRVTPRFSAFPTNYELDLVVT
ncbi:MAG: hypothetical protein AB4042_15315 [Leptolyngbyaceae cyanobacterium]